MRAAYCMCVDPKLNEREIVCSLGTYTQLRKYLTGSDYRIRLNEDVEENTVIMSREMYAMIYQDMLDILSVKESGLSASDSNIGIDLEEDCSLDWSDSELTFSDSCV